MYFSTVFYCHWFGLFQDMVLPIGQTCANYRPPIRGSRHKSQNHLDVGRCNSKASETGFYSLAADHTIEVTVNRESKTSGGITLTRGNNQVLILKLTCFNTFLLEMGIYHLFQAQFSVGFCPSPTKQRFLLNVVRWQESTLIFDVTKRLIKHGKTFIFSHSLKWCRSIQQFT